MLALLLAGCAGKPNAANIELRKENQRLQDRIVTLEQTLEAQRAAVRSLEQNATSVPTLPADRIDELFVTTGLSLGRLTGVADWDTTRDGADGVKIYVVPTDATGDPLKAAGSFVVEAFDLSKDQPRVGKWSFSVEESKALWLGSGLLYEYVLPCPMDWLPEAGELTIKVTFTEALTGRVFSVQKLVQSH
jgi:hypothetical protein